MLEEDPESSEAFLKQQEQLLLEELKTEPQTIDYLMRTLMYHLDLDPIIKSPIISILTYHQVIPINSSIIS